MKTQNKNLNKTHNKAPKRMKVLKTFGLTSLFLIGAAAGLGAGFGAQIVKTQDKHTATTKPAQSIASNDLPQLDTLLQSTVFHNDNLLNSTNTAPSILITINNQDLIQAIKDTNNTITSNLYFMSTNATDYTLLSSNQLSTLGISFTPISSTNLNTTINFNNTNTSINGNYMFALSITNNTTGQTATYYSYTNAIKLNNNYTSLFSGTNTITTNTTSIDSTNTTGSFTLTNNLTLSTSANNFKTPPLITYTWYVYNNNFIPTSTNFNTSANLILTKTTTTNTLSLSNLWFNSQASNLNFACVISVTWNKTNLDLSKSNMDILSNTITISYNKVINSQTITAPSFSNVSFTNKYITQTSTQNYIWNLEANKADTSTSTFATYTIDLNKWSGDANSLTPFLIYTNINNSDSIYQTSNNNSLPFAFNLSIKNNIATLSITLTNNFFDFFKDTTSSAITFMCGLSYNNQSYYSNASTIYQINNNIITSTINNGASYNFQANSSSNQITINYQNKINSAYSWNNNINIIDISNISATLSSKQPLSLTSTHSTSTTGTITFTAPITSQTITFTFSIQLQVYGIKFTFNIPATLTYTYTPLSAILPSMSIVSNIFSNGLVYNTTTSSNNGVITQQTTALMNLHLRTNNIATAITMPAFLTLALEKNMLSSFSSNNLQIDFTMNNSNNTSSVFKATMITNSTDFESWLHNYNKTIAVVLEASSNSVIIKIFVPKQFGSFMLNSNITSFVINITNTNYKYTLTINNIGVVGYLSYSDGTISVGQYNQGQFKSTLTDNTISYNYKTDPLIYNNDKIFYNPITSFNGAVCNVSATSYEDMNNLLANYNIDLNYDIYIGTTLANTTKLSSSDYNINSANRWQAGTITLKNTLTASESVVLIVTLVIVSKTNPSLSLNLPIYYSNIYN